MEYTIDKDYEEHASCVNNAVRAFTYEETNKYAERAKEIYPDDFDTLRVCAIAEIRKNHQDPVEAYLQYEKALRRADEVIREDESGKYEGINDWYRSLHGRPYLRLKRGYAYALLNCGMMDQALKQYEDIVELSHYDGYGDRYKLAAIYAFLGDRIALENLMKKYEGCCGSGIFLPASVCFFKRGDLIKAERYLRKAYDCNNNFKTFLEKTINRNFRQKTEEIYDKCLGEGYLADSYEECVFEVLDTMFLYASVPAFFDWARRKVRKFD